MKTNLKDAADILKEYVEPGSLVDCGNLFFAAGEYQKHCEDLKMVCRRLAAASTLEIRDRIARQCHHLFEGKITRMGQE